MKKWLVVVMMVVPITACAVPLTEAGAGVRLMKADPPVECSELGPVTGHATASGGALDPAQTLAQSKNDARNRAAEMGANYLRWEASDGEGGTVTGTAYKCPGA